MGPGQPSKRRPLKLLSGHRHRLVAVKKASSEVAASNNVTGSSEHSTANVGAELDGEAPTDPREHRLPGRLELAHKHNCRLVQALRARDEVAVKECYDEMMVVSRDYLTKYRDILF